MTAQLWWYLARASGIVAWALLAGSVVWGLALSTRILGTNPKPNWMLDLHRFLGGLALTFTGIHLVSLVLDTYVSFGPLQLLVPLTSSYRPGAVAWGIVGFYLLAAVELTSLLRRHISKRVWRMTHLLSFPLFVTSTVHGLLAGTDGTGAPLYGAMAAVSLLVLALSAASFDYHRTRRLDPPPSRIPARHRHPTHAGSAGRVVPDEMQGVRPSERDVGEEAQHLVLHEL